MTSFAAPARPLALASPAAEVDVWMCELVRTRDDIAALETTLSDAERARAARFGPPELRERYVVGRATLRSLLGRKLALPPEQVVIGRGRRGRPHVAGADLDFNVSHTRGLAIFGITAGCRIGVDIEHGEREVNVPGVSRKFMSPREQAALAELEEGDARRRALLRLWTCKEAMSKATGDALSAPFRKLDIVLESTPRLEDGPPPYTPGRWRLLAVEVPDGYLATVALWHEQASL